MLPASLKLGLRVFCILVETDGTLICHRKRDGVRHDLNARVFEGRDELLAMLVLRFLLFDLHGRLA
jgi:hypothetical protein